jgi:hypothetical protein
LRGGGFDGGVLIVPDALGFMKLQQVDRMTAKMLEARDQRERAKYEAKVAQIKKETDAEEKAKTGSVTELHPDTETEGEA